MVNTISSTKRRKRRGPQSFVPAPERLRPLVFKTAIRLALEAAMIRDLGLPREVVESAPGGTLTTYAWRGPRAAA